MSDQFRDLLLEHLPRLQAYAIMLTRDRSAASDLLQETALRALRAQDQFTLGTNFAAWIYRILRNEHFSSLRRSKRKSTRLEDIPEERDSRFNDVIADQAGRVFCGTMSSDYSSGRLYRLDRNRVIRPVIASVGCSNGMGFTPDLKGLYHTDSFAGLICRFDYIAHTGELENREIFAIVPSSDGLPDGLTVDRNGCVWSALWDGSSLVRFDAQGRIDIRISLPTRKVSSLAFGGPDLQDVYITTAGGNTKEEDGPAAGSLLRLRLGVSGRPEFFSNIVSAGH